MALLLLVPALSAQQPEELTLDYKEVKRRDPNARAATEEVAKPAAAALPSELRVTEPTDRKRVEAPPEEPAAVAEPDEVPLESSKGGSRIELGEKGRQQQQDQGRGRGRDDRRPPARPTGGISNRDIADDASRAAEWTARKLVDERGRVQYYRVGLWQGLRDALDRSQRQRRAFEEGLDDGENDPRADRVGQRAADQAADQAEKAAIDAFDRELDDLQREPRRQLNLPIEPVPRGLVRVPEPRLEDVFADYPLGPRLRQSYLRTAPDAFQLYRLAAYRDVYDRDWQNGRKAFEYFQREGETRLWNRLDRVRQDYYRRVFEADFEYFSKRELARVADRAYREGYDDGWDYGAMVGGEFRYRQGFREAFVVAAERSARDGWSSAWQDAFDRTYRDRYQEWSNAVLPELRDHEILDENGDGIFEPGENLRLRLEVWNRGGASGAVDVQVDATELQGDGRDSLNLRRRSGGEAEVELRIDPRTPPRTEAKLEVRLNDERETLPLRIRRPLEFGQSPRATRIDALAGTVELSADLGNAGGRPLRYQIEAAIDDRRVESPAARIESRGRAQVREVVDGLAPIDLLAGGQEVTLEVMASGAGREGGRDGRGGRGGDGGPGGVDFEETGDGEELRAVDSETGGLRGRPDPDRPRRPGRPGRPGEDWELHDRVTFRLPELANDLADRQLVDFWVALQRGEDVGSVQDGNRAIELLAGRIALDWDRQRNAGSGNPYKDDLTAARTKTALGELVRASRGVGRPARPELQRALAQRLRGLAGNLPGTHPFLRGSFEKLVAELGR